ncbi:TolC family protein [Pontibacter burrus]|uniref:TolC family protein n=1 Tax=Pontibacter burrus TaxID=2704466 RepID=A0A6B3LVN2_9BACT|nr:TolC family protein [Pontibacter burrus]NEM99025.1 TolC family protein [Pontibacter burrus]
MFTRSFHLFLLLLAFLLIQQAKAQAPLPNPSDTLRVSLTDMEQRFLQQNLPLLAQKYSIEASKAAIIQAKLFENPELSVEQNIYNSNTGRYFETGRNGQNVVQLQQLIHMAGQRNKRIRVEQLNSQLTELEYYDLVRTLRLELRSSYLDLHYQLQQYHILNEHAQSVQELVTAFDGQYKKGNVALKEMIRLKALLLALDNQKLELITQINQNQSDLRLLTSAPTNTFFLPTIDETTIEGVKTGLLTFDQALQVAQENRSDLQAASTGILRQEAVVKYEKALAIPDISLGGIYDRNGSIMNNYTGITLQMPLPLWNRNQGNIKIAKSELERSRTLYAQQQLQVENEVMQALQALREAEQLYNKSEQNLSSDFKRLISGVTENFAKRNISLIEFIDYYETYTETMTQLLQLRNSRIRAIEELNYTVGFPLITY